MKYLLLGLLFIIGCSNELKPGNCYSDGWRDYARILSITDRGKYFNYKKIEYTHFDLFNVISNDKLVSDKEFIENYPLRIDCEILDDNHRIYKLKAAIRDIKKRLNKLEREKK